jgi:AraC-like DNA-binding protein
MPYDRYMLANTATVTAERVVLLESSNRWGPEYETSALKFIVPLSGYVHVRARSGEDLIDGTTLFAMSPRSTYQMLQRVPQTSMVLTVHDEALANEITNDNQEAGCRIVEPGAIAPLHRILKLSKDRLATEELLVDSVVTLSSSMKRSGERNCNVSATGARATLRAREYLATHFAENFSLAEIARASCSSSFHLSRTFRSRYGVPLFAFRNRLRIAAALRALAERKPCDLSALAFELGYASARRAAAMRSRLRNANNGTP